MSLKIGRATRFGELSRGRPPGTGDGAEDPKGRCSRGRWDSLPEATRQILRENAWTVVLQQPEPVTCAQFGSLKMPVLLVMGELTTPRFKQLVQEQSTCLPQATVKTIPKAGHSSPALNPTAFKEAVATFLQR